MAIPLRAEILELEEILREKKKRLFFDRLQRVAGKPLNETIHNIKMTLNLRAGTWQISYLHKTDKFTPLDYLYNKEPDSGDDDPNANANTDNSNTAIVDPPAPISKETRIDFGKASVYFIKGGVKLHIYRNTAGELRVINRDYEFELDLDEQRALVTDYADNPNLPEWFAITTMLYLSDNKWDDQSWINHLSIV